jgi:hypothetical protein
MKGERFLKEDIVLLAKHGFLVDLANFLEGKQKQELMRLIQQCEAGDSSEEIKNRIDELKKMAQDRIWFLKEQQRIIDEDFDDMTSWD